VGRAGELASLENALHAALSGDPQLVLLSGPAGIGKTRLLDELADRARSAGVLGLRGRAREDLVPTFQPFGEVVRDQLHAAPEALERLLGLDARRLTELARQATTVADTGSSTDRPHDRLLLYGAVSRATCELARLRPCAVLLDDPVVRGGAVSFPVHSAGR